MQARYYDPVMGRFLSIDPVGFADTGSPSYFNRYRYCSNDPVNCFDPTGMSDDKNIFEKIVDKVQSIEVAPNWQPSSAMETTISNSQLSGDAPKASVGNAALESTAKAAVEASPEVGATVAVGTALAATAELTAGVRVAAGAVETVGSGFAPSAGVSVTPSVTYANGAANATRISIADARLPAVMQPTGTTAIAAGTTNIELAIAAQASRRSFAGKVADVVQVVVGPF